MTFSVNSCGIESNTRTLHAMNGAQMLQENSKIWAKFIENRNDWDSNVKSNILNTPI